MKRVNLNGRGSEERLRNAGEKTVIRSHYMRKITLSIKVKTEKMNI